MDPDITDTVRHLIGFFIYVWSASTEQLKNFGSNFAITAPVEARLTAQRLKSYDFAMCTALEFDIPPHVLGELVHDPGHLLVQHDPTLLHYGHGRRFSRPF